MKKYIFITTCFFTSLLQSMEKQPLSLDTVFNGTIVRVTHGSILNAHNNVDLIFVNDVTQMKKTPTIPPSTLTVQRNNNGLSTGKKLLNTQQYYYKKSVPNIKNYSIAPSEQQACLDIGTYYATILTEGINRINSNKQICVALCSLENTSGFSDNMTIAGTSAGIFEFIDLYPYTYNMIELFVKTEEEVKIYTELHKEYIEEKREEEQKEAEKTAKK